jgi:hypothetical protein
VQNSGTNGKGVERCRRGGTGKRQTFTTRLRFFPGPSGCRRERTIRRSSRWLSLRPGHPHPRHIRHTATAPHFCQGQDSLRRNAIRHGGRNAPDPATPRVRRGAGGESRRRPARLARRIGLPLMLAFLAPSAQPDAGGGSVAERHRWAGVGFHAQSLLDRLNDCNDQSDHCRDCGGYRSPRRPLSDLDLTFSGFPRHICL